MSAQQPKALEEMIFHKKDFDQFREWINLNLEALTWQGRYAQEFEEFWEIFFVDGLSLIQVMERFRYATNESKIGPLISWFNWLFERFLSFVFINQDISIYQLSLQTDLPVAKVASILRNFFLNYYPYLDDYLSETFQISNVASANLYLTFNQMAAEGKITSALTELERDDVMPSMEITLYEEWRAFLQKMKREIYHPQFDFKKIKASASFNKQWRLLREISLMILLGFILMLGIKKWNEYREKKMVEKISIYEPQFKWLDKNLSFKPFTGGKKITPVEFDFEDIEDAENQKIVDVVNTNRYETESEVVLTSWDSLPRDFGTADLEQSDYEELKKRGYRESRYGNTKVYRVMMKSVDTNTSRQKLNDLIGTYSVTQVDNVKPGKAVPGGFYYNLYVPRTHLKEFLAQVVDVDDSILYESRTRTTRNPAGKNKVFIWVKSI
ncbi:MAG: hypothetical protein HN509_09465 [Halobacteriovoraceae bacterium]|jgi:hypothetical protein|nr:hypothetical protein [Halobacteriovoraceae bacterium]MBT5095388.1 hypothetical protein [Halobacteriovoraceae bacterium]